MKLGLIVILLYFLPLVLIAQEDQYEKKVNPCAATCLHDVWCWGCFDSDIEEAKNNYALMSDHIKEESYALAKPSMEWLIENIPYLNKSIYIQGVKIYRELLKTETNQDSIRAYQDRILELLDLRMLYFGEEAKVWQMKGQYAYSFLSKSKTSKDLEQLYQIYEKIFEINGNNTSRSNLIFLLFV